VARDEIVELSAKLLDDQSREIPDMNFAWSLTPVSGNATISSVSRDGQKGFMKNVYQLRSGTLIHTGGTVKVKATAHYHGVLYSGESEEITLNR
jgi:hypothetical protein